MEDRLVYLNGKHLPVSEAYVPVLDRGFILGDGVYDVLPVYGRRLFRHRDHLARLDRSLRLIGIEPPLSESEWLAAVRPLIADWPEDDQLVYMQVTRGVAPRGHAFPQSPLKPTLFAMCCPFPRFSEQQRTDGVACVTKEDMRWLHCNIKSISLLGNVLAAQYSAEHQATEVIQFRQDVLSEAASSNVWIVKDGRVCGPSSDNRVLEGIRYGLLHELCREEGLPLSLRDITREEVFAADEVILSSSGKEVLPVTRIDGLPVGNGKPGPVYQRLYAAYQRAKAKQLAEP